LVGVPHLALAVGFLLVDPRAQTVDVSGGVTVEVRGGRAPVTPSPLATPRAGFMMIVQPNVDFSTVHRSRGSFLLGFAPRVQWRLPNRLEIKRPILLNEAYLRYAVGLTRRWSLSIDASGAVGEVDYTAFSLAFGEEQATTADVQVAQFGIAHASIDVVAIPGPRSRVSFGPRFDARIPYGRSASSSDDEDSMGEEMMMGTGGLRTLPQQISGGFSATYEYALDWRDSLDVSAFPGVVDYDNELSFATVDARLGWGRRLTELWTSHIDFGVFVAHMFRRPDPERDQMTAVRRQDPTRVFPVGSLDLAGRLWSGARGRHLEGNLGAGVIGFFDRVVQRVDPRAFVTLALNASLPPRWAVGVRGSMYTSATPDARPPRQFGDDLVELPETVIQAQTPVTYEIDHQTRFEFGTILSVRGSHLDSNDFKFSMLETWAYCAIRFSGSTARGRRELGPRSSGTIGAGLSGLTGNR